MHDTEKVLDHSLFYIHLIHTKSTQVKRDGRSLNTKERVWNAGQLYHCHGVYILLQRIFVGDATCTISFHGFGCA